MTKNVAILFLSTLLFLSAGVHGQDPVFTHFHANRLIMNPSMAGIDGPWRLFMGYRNQWPNTGSSYLTYQASYDQFVERLDGGLGVRVMNDRQGGGVFNAYNLDLMYSYQFRATRRLSLSGGIQAGIGQRSFDPASLVFGDMINPVTGEITAGLESVSRYSEIYPDFAVGMSAFSGIFHGGIAVHHLLNPVVTDKSDPAGTVPRKYTAHLGAMVPVIERRTGRELLQLSPNMVIIRQQTVLQINYGLDVIYRDVIAGVWTRHDLLFNYGNLIFTAGYSYGNLHFRYSYDIKLSSPTVRLPNMGAHEFSLVILNEKQGIRKSERTIKIPKI
jgi:type IX secretion system PorP/SprF family membrane protein